MTSNLVSAGKAEKMKSEKIHTSEPKNPSTDSRMYEVLIRTMEHGDGTSVGHALNIPQQHVNEMIAGRRRAPFEAAALWTERLIENGNENALQPLLALCRRLKLVAYPIPQSATGADAKFSRVLKEVSDVVRERSEAEEDARIETHERRAIAQQLSELIEAASAYRDEQLRLAAEDEAKVLRIAR